MGDRGEMVGWCHRLNGHEFEQALGIVEGQGSLAHCSPCTLKESDTTEQLNNCHCPSSYYISSVQAGLHAPHFSL